MRIGPVVQLADLNDYSPTCGWQYDQEIQKIWHSQGFCCACLLSEIVWTQGNFLRGTSCEFMELESGSSIAHCLRYEEPSFSSFSVGAPSMEYTIRVSIASANAENETYQMEHLYISNKDKQGKSDDLQLKAELVSDLMPSQKPPSLENKILLIPSSPAEHQIVQN